MQALRHFLLAVQFFSRIPITGRVAAWVGWSPQLQRASAAHLPGVGWLVGAWGGAWLWAAAWLLQSNPWMPLVAAVLSTASTLWLTGGFHEDGLADVADGLGGFTSPERALEIMKDSRVGAYGVMALVVGLLSKVALLAALVAISPLLAAVVLGCTHVLSRAAPLALMRWLPYVGLQAQSKTLHVAGQQLGTRGLCTALLWCAPAGAVLLHTTGPCTAAAMALAWVVATVLMGRWLRRRLKGISGDGLGACQQVAELALLFAASAALALGWGAGASLG